MRIPAAACLLLIPVILAACTEEVDPGRGGTRTAQLGIESFAARGKLTECLGEAPLPDLWRRIFASTTSLPVTGGWESQWLMETADVLASLLAAQDCEALFQAMNFGVAPAACEVEGASCVGDVARECRRIGQRLLRFDTDCTRPGMTCLDGRCVLGPCATASCDGDSLVTCDADGRKSIFLCGAIGLECGVGGNGMQCVGQGDTCTTTDEENPVVPRCTASTLTWCLGGRLASVDCAALTDGRRTCLQAWLDGHTDVSANDILDLHFAEACGPTGTDCYGSASDCDGNYLKLCIDGFYEYQSCTDLQTAGCSTPGVFGPSASCKGFPASAR